MAVPERGLLMGNRGLLHDRHGRLKREWRLLAWITCLLEFKNRRRPIMAPGQYTELFFLDEATALAAGHRPCAECRRDDFVRFKKLWLLANPGLIRTEFPRIRELDEILHHDRLSPDGRKRRFTAKLADLPDGVFVLTPVDDDFCLIHRRHLLRWSPGGYLNKRQLPPETRVSVLTPASTVRTLAAGYRPKLHPSVDNSFV